MLNAAEGEAYQSPGGGKRRPMNQKNYHTMTNNAVFPSNEPDDPTNYHYHSKVVPKDLRNPRLAPTLRSNQAPLPTAQNSSPTHIYEGHIVMSTNAAENSAAAVQRQYSPESPGANNQASASKLSIGMSEY